MSDEVMVLIEDKGQQANKHKLKHSYWTLKGIEYVQFPLPTGDYILLNDSVLDMINRKRARGLEPKKMDFLGTYTLAIDTKRDIQELVGNVCGKEHARFRDELILAKNNNIKLIVLIENEGGVIPYTGGKIINDTVYSINDLFSWKNPRLFIRKKGIQVYSSATKGSTLAKALITLEHKYNVKFEFCKPSDAGRKIVEILESEVNNG